MRIAVTGATPRVGRAVVDHAVSLGHDVVAIDRVIDRRVPEGPEWVELDLRDYPALVEAVAGCDALMHLAAIAGPGMNPDHEVHDNNVVSSYHALRAAAEVGIRRVSQASSINAIGGRFSSWPRDDYLPLDEQHPAYPEDPYSLSKLICEQQGETIVRSFEGTVIASLRLHGVVESRSDATGWTDTPSVELRADHYPEVPVTGDLAGARGFFDCRKAAEILGWNHDAGEHEGTVT